MDQEIGRLRNGEGGEDGDEEKVSMGNEIEVLKT